MPSTLTTRRSVILPGGATEPAPVHPLDQVNTYTRAILNRRYPFLIHAYRPPWHEHNGTFLGRRDPVTGTWSSQSANLEESKKGPPYTDNLRWHRIAKNGYFTL
ncbi:hypothetical protein DFH27DRAFT_614750 [Peziza echinospora]|nr:hypothetical protein DFH27DRAFT_614750 [Peziza echinospora]